MSLSKACAIAANNTSTITGQEINYIRLANIAAERVKYYLGLPVLLITNETVIHDKDIINFTGIIHYENTPTSSNRAMLAGNEIIKYSWKNDLRIAAYDTLKDYAHRILMIDADYMVGSDQLKAWTEADTPFNIFDNVVDISGRNVYAEKQFPSKDIVQRWATGMCWSYCEQAEAVFETAKMVRDNYAFYALMLGMPSTPYRNDVAFSVACHLQNIPTSSLPILFNLPADSFLYDKASGNDDWIIATDNYMNFWSSDVHILNKLYAIDETKMQELTLNNVAA